MNVSTLLYDKWDSWTIYAFGFLKFVLFWARFGQTGQFWPVLTNSTPKYNCFWKSEYIDRSGIWFYVHSGTYFATIVGCLQMRLYLLSCGYFVRKCMVVGTIAFHGMSVYHECKYMGIRRIEFLIDVCIRIYKKSYILGSKWSKRSKLTSLTKTSPK